MNIDEKIEAMASRLAEIGFTDDPANQDIETIQAAICAAFGFSHATLVSKLRTEELANARMASMQLCRARLELSLNEVGRVHGGRDHGTVLHAIRRVGELLETNADFRRRYSAVVLLLGGTGITSP